MFFLFSLYSPQQLDVQLGAGRIELTDLNINVRAVAELLPNLPFRFVRAHVGRLRVEISYAKLLTESLAFYLDDIYIEIAPPFEDDTDTGTHRSDVGAAPFEHEAKGPLSAGIMGNKSRFLDRRNQAEEAASKAKGAESVPCRKVQMGDTGEGLDFVAQWIEQITSKVKVVVQSLTVRVASAARLEGASHTAHDDERSPFVDIRCSSLRWCDETPESSMLVPEGARGPHSTAPNATRLDNTRKPVPGAGFTQKVGRCCSCHIELVHPLLLKIQNTAVVATTCMWSCGTITSSPAVLCSTFDLWWTCTYTTWLIYAMENRVAELQGSRLHVGVMTLCTFAHPYHCCNPQPCCGAS